MKSLSSEKDNHHIICNLNPFSKIVESVKKKKRKKEEEEGEAKQIATFKEVQ